MPLGEERSNAPQTRWSTGKNGLSIKKFFAILAWGTSKERPDEGKQKVEGGVGEQGSGNIIGDNSQP
jgi:hypothetical protein